MFLKFIFYLDSKDYIELVPDLVWIESESPSPPPPLIHNDPILDHPMPQIPSKFLMKIPIPEVSKQEVSVIRTAVIVATIHFMFDFFR